MISEPVPIWPARLAVAWILAVTAYYLVRHGSAFYADNATALREAWHRLPVLFGFG